MTIAKKKSHKSGDIIFVFRFTDENELDYFIRRTLSSDATEDSETAERLISKIKLRADTKYADAEHQLSFHLYGDELIEYFIIVIDELMQNRINALKEYNDLAEKHSNLIKEYTQSTREHTNLIKEYRKLLEL